MTHDPDRPGSRGEHVLQDQYGTSRRAKGFYDRQVLDFLNPHMQEFIRRQLAKRDKTIAWGTDDVRLKGGDFVRTTDGPADVNGNSDTEEQP